MSPLFALGVDVSTTTTALVVLDHTGHYAHKLVQHKTGDQGARRLMQIRHAVTAALDAARWDLDVAAVEMPYNRHRSPGLEQAAAVVLEAVQARYPHLIVLDVVPSEWQAATVGIGKDPKRRSLEHANANGLDTRDDNLSDSYCIAEYARDLYIRDVLDEVA
jgi:Holliday junction resolvasome RuvABC endonuclease subunit